MCLAQVGELAAQLIRNFAIARLVAHKICALIGAVDGVELVAQFRLVGDGPELIQAI